MPRTRRQTEAPLLPSTALVASSMRYPGRAPRIYQPRHDWQQEAYRHYAICGEARFAARFFGHAVSRAILSAATVDGSGKIEAATSGPAYDYLQALFNGKDGQEAMLEAIGTHLSIAGECYLVGRTVTLPDGTDSEVWEIVSVIEILVSGTQWSISYGEGLPPIALTEEDVVIRIWTPSPSRRIEADSPFRSLLPILSEIEYLTRHVFSQVTSRLAGAGILFLPQGMTFPPAPPTDGNESEVVNDADAFMRVLADAMITPISDPGSPAALVPIVVTAPDEVIDKAKLMHFWSELDAQSKDMRSEAIRRFALGMDLPPEQILGMSSRGGTGGGQGTAVSHWGAWQIEEATIKLHVEPMLDVIVNALTMGYLRPLLSGSDGERALVIYDSSALRLRPDRSKEAFELYDRGLLAVEALFREVGFNITDKIGPEEFKTWLIAKVASGSATPDQVQAALKLLGIDLGIPLASEVAAPQQITREARPTPSLLDHPVNDLPDAASLLHASEGLVFRALERAGNRLRQSTGTKPPGPSYEAHTLIKANGSADSLLADAWSCAPQVLEGLGDPDKVIPVLNSYCKTLLAQGEPHSRERLSEWLSRGLVIR